MVISCIELQAEVLILSGSSSPASAQAKCPLPDQVSKPSDTSRIGTMLSHLIVLVAHYSMYVYELSCYSSCNVAETLVNSCMSEITGWSTNDSRQEHF